MKALEHDSKEICKKLLAGIKDQALKNVLTAVISSYYPDQNEGKEKQTTSNLVSSIINGDLESAAQ